ncbi:M23 family metallopeptidase [Leucobacter chromiireducens]|uniref:M23 family metallopeptidase n=1 Tax=Leucobacter chromiireducens TaxID=283877 RepID=UPI000F62EC4F|nr:peptidoglycan DD-metalloendopeptidase family protein [Leucobacter chromiireducens]
MLDSSPSASRPFPSRRALREAAARSAAQTEQRATDELAQDPELIAEREPEAESERVSDPALGAEPEPERVSDPELSTAPQDDVLAGGYVRVPLPERDLATGADSAAPAPQPRRPLRRRIAAAAAAASVGGLVLSAAVPLTQAAEEEVAAAASQQRLFSEVSADDIPASLAEISAVDVDEAIAGTYTYRARALVNYPFQQSVLLTDPFGYRTAPVEQFHDAQDFGAAAGTPIYAIADGTVLEAGFASDGCGFGLKLEHDIDGKEVTSRYCHMQDASHSYAVGDEVLMGDPVGRVGATGLAFGAHLHMALRVNDEPTDPMPFLAKYSRVDRTAENTTPGKASETS